MNLFARVYSVYLAFNRCHKQRSINIYFGDNLKLQPGQRHPDFNLIVEQSLVGPPQLLVTIDSGATVGPGWVDKLVRTLRTIN